MSVTRNVTVPVGRSAMLATLVRGRALECTPARPRPQTGGLRCIRPADYNFYMYDAIRGTYTFACPSRGESRVTPSAFREFERPPGAAHPAVYKIRFECPCGEEHPAFVSHDDLDWAPLGLVGGVFLNPDDVAARQPRRGARRPGRTPDPGGRLALELLLLSGGAAAAGLPRRRLPARARRRIAGAGRAVSILLADVGQPRLAHARRRAVHHDATVGVVEHVFQDDAATAIEEFRAELYSVSFDVRRLRPQ